MARVWRGGRPKDRANLPRPWMNELGLRIMEGATFGISREGFVSTCVEVGLRMANTPGTDLGFFHAVDEQLLSELEKSAPQLPVSRERFWSWCRPLLARQTLDPSEGTWEFDASRWLTDGEQLARVRPGSSKYVSVGVDEDLVEQVLVGVRDGSLPALSKDEFVRSCVAPTLRVMQSMTPVFKAEKWACRQVLLEGSSASGEGPFVQTPPPWQHARTEFANVHNFLRWVLLLHLKRPLS